jgi:hypothetical protein
MTAPCAPLPPPSPHPHHSSPSPLLLIDLLDSLNDALVPRVGAWQWRGAWWWHSGMPRFLQELSKPFCPVFAKGGGNEDCCRRSLGLVGCLAGEQGTPPQVVGSNGGAPAPADDARPGWRPGERQWRTSHRLPAAQAPPPGRRPPKTGTGPATRPAWREPARPLPPRARPLPRSPPRTVSHIQACAAGGMG